jgi:hypothetical protein
MESAHQAQTSETWEANLRLHDYVRQNADRVQAGNISYAESLPGINAAYRDSMTKTAALMVSASEKAAIIAGESYEIRASQQAVNLGQKLVEAAVTAVASRALSYVGGQAMSFDPRSDSATPGETSGTGAAAAVSGAVEGANKPYDANAAALDEWRIDRG